MYPSPFLWSISCSRNKQDMWLIVNKNGRAGSTHQHQVQSVSAVSLGVFEAVSRRCMEKLSTCQC